MIFIYLDRQGKSQFENPYREGLAEAEILGAVTLLPTSPRTRSNPKFRQTIF